MSVYQSESQINGTKSYNQHIIKAVPSAEVYIIILRLSKAPSFYGNRVKTEMRSINYIYVTLHTKTRLKHGNLGETGFPTPETGFLKGFQRVCKEFSKGFQRVSKGLQRVDATLLVT